MLLLFAFSILISFGAAIASGESFSDGVITQLTASRVAQYPLLRSPLYSDYVHALLHARPRRMGLDSWATIQNISIAEVPSITGFVFEQRYARLKSVGNVTYDVFYAGDEATDVLETDRRTGKQARLQLYAGKNTRTALEKLLISDRVSDRLVLPKDTYDHLVNSVNQASNIWQQYRSGAISLSTAVVEMRRVLQPHGLFVDERGIIWYGTGRRVAIALGAADRESFQARFRKLERWPETSDTLLALTDRARYQSKPAYRWLINDLSEQTGSKATAIRTVRNAIIDSAGDNPGFRELAAASLQHEIRAKAWASAREQSLRLARVVHLPEEEVHEIFNRRVNPMAAGARSAHAAVRQRALWRSLYEPYAWGASSVMGVVVLSGCLEWMSSGQDFREWLANNEGQAWLVRGISATSALGSAFLIERALWDWSIAGSQQRLWLRTLGGLGISSLIFAFGEFVVEYAIQGHTFQEALSRSGTTLLITSLAAVTAYALVSSGFVSGAWAGPVGIVIGLSIASAYNFWRAWRDQQLNQAIEHGRWEGWIEQARRAVSQQR